MTQGSFISIISVYYLLTIDPYFPAAKTPMPQHGFCLGGATGVCANLLLGSAFIPHPTASALFGLGWGYHCTGCIFLKDKRNDEWSVYPVGQLCLHWVFFFLFETLKPPKRGGQPQWVCHMGYIQILLFLSQLFSNHEMHFWNINEYWRWLILNIGISMKFGISMNIGYDYLENQYYVNIMKPPFGPLGLKRNTHPSHRSLIQFPAD